MQKKYPEGSFQSRNGVWCVKKKCKRCDKEFNAGLDLNPEYCKGCRQILKKRKEKKPDKSRERAFVAQKKGTCLAADVYGLAEKTHLKQGQRCCHDCGKPSNGNYRCAACWLRVRGGGETAQRVDNDYVYA